MKRMYIGLGLLAVMLAVGIWVTVMFDRIHAPLSATLDQAQAAALAGDWEQAGILTGQAHAQWRRARELIAAVADHAPLEEMDALFARLEVLQQMHQADEFASDCAELSSLASAMADSQRILWWNLL